MFLDIENGATGKYIEGCNHFIGCEVDYNGWRGYIFGVLKGRYGTMFRVASLPVSGTWSWGYVHFDDVMFITEDDDLVTYEEYMNIYYTQYDYKDGE